MAWQDVANQRLGGIAPSVIASLSGINPNYDWSAAIKASADQSDQQWGAGAWSDPGRGSPSAFTSGVLGNAQKLDPTSGWTAPFVPQLNAAGQQEAAAIQKQQNPPDKGGLFGGGLGTALGIAGLAAGGYGLLSGLGGAASGAAGAFDLFSPSTWSIGNWLSGANAVNTAGSLLADAGTTMTDVGGGTLGSIAGDGAADTGGLLGGAGGAMDMVGSAAIPGAAGLEGGIGAGSVFSGAAGAGAGLGGLFSGIPLSSLMSLGGGVSSLIGANAAQRAAQQQAGAANQATAAQLGMFNTLNAQGAPYRAAGYGALGPLTAGIGLGPSAGGVDTGQFTHQFNAADLNANLAPNYEFMKQQGLGATQNLLNASGGSLSGNTLQGLTKFGTDYAGTGYQNAFNNYTTNQNNIFGRLSQIAGLGTTANQQSAGAGASISPGISQSIQTMGGAQASGTVGAANAMTGGINNALGWYALPQMLNRNFG